MDVSTTGGSEVTLSTTIEQLLERQRVQQADGPFKADLVRGWQEDVRDVLRRIHDAIEPYEQRGMAIVERDAVEIFEEALGTYEAGRLVLIIAGRRIVVMPVARVTLGGTGRIDMYRDDRPSEQDRFLVVRTQQGADQADPIWLMENKDEVPPDTLLPERNLRRAGRRFYALTSPVIESAIDFLLKMA